MPKKSLIVRWTEADIARLAELAGRGFTLFAATAALRRPSITIQKKAREMGLYFAGPRELQAKMRQAEAEQAGPRK